MHSQNTRPTLATNDNSYFMATRLRVRKTKMKKDRATEHKKSPKKRPHKIDQANRKKIQSRKINRAR
jgi:hypothetical protein